MGGSWSNNNNRNRRRNSYHEHYPPPPPTYYYQYSSQPHPMMPQPQPPQGYFPPHSHHFYSNLPHQPSYAAAAATTTTNTQPFGVDLSVNAVAQPPPPPPYVDHETAKKVKNDVNLHKHTLQLHLDPNNSDHHLISFVFDALYDGRFVTHSILFTYLCLVSSRSNN